MSVAVGGGGGNARSSNGSQSTIGLCQVHQRVTEQTPWAVLSYLYISTIEMESKSLPPLIVHPEDVSTHQGKNKALNYYLFCEEFSLSWCWTRTARLS
jgi:hypothetical protein